MHFHKKYYIFTYFSKEFTYFCNIKHILFCLFQGYYQHIVDSKTLNITVVERECLFGNILEIYNFSR